MWSTRNAVVVANARPPSATRERSIVRRFLLRAQQAGVNGRAEAASALARAYLHSGLPSRLKDEVALALASFADDSCVEVRRALAEALSSARSAPRRLVVALATDQAEVAAPVLARSPLLTDAELIDCVAVGDVVSQCAVARRPCLGAGPAVALADVGAREAALALIGNCGADLTPRTLRRLVARFGDDAEIREALLARPSLPASLKAEIAVATSETLSRFVSSAGWLGSDRARRVAIEARDAALASIAANCADRECPELARKLRERGALTMALLLRSLLEGERRLVSASLAELSGQPYARAAALAREPLGEGFAALALKAGIPCHALPAFRAALRAIEIHGVGEGAGLKPRLVDSVIAACEARRDPALEPILSLLWRFAAEAARAEARAIAKEPMNAAAFRLPTTTTRRLPRLPDGAIAAASAPSVSAAQHAQRADDAAPTLDVSRRLILRLDAA